MVRRAQPAGCNGVFRRAGNHHDGIAAMDFFVVPTATFRVLYVLFVIHHGRRRIMHVGVTEHPTSRWVIQQLREAFPYDEVPEHLVFDRDSKFSVEVIRTIESMGIKPAKTSYRSPWQNGVAERWVSSVRTEMLDHIILLNEEHLRRLMFRYVAYYHHDRTHLGLEKDSPIPRPVENRPREGGTVVSLPRVGGLHYRYEWRKAA